MPLPINFVVAIAIPVPPGPLRQTIPHCLGGRLYRTEEFEDKAEFGRWPVILIHSRLGGARFRLKPPGKTAVEGVLMTRITTARALCMTYLFIGACGGKPEPPPADVGKELDYLQSDKAVEDYKRQLKAKEGLQATQRERSAAQAIINERTATPAEDLIKAYEDNEVAADLQFKGKTLLVSGEVESIGKDFLNNPYITLQSTTPFGFRLLQATFAPAAERELATLSKGSRVFVRGICTGMLGNVHLKDAALQ